jgi:BolA protein
MTETNPLQLEITEKLTQALRPSSLEVIDDGAQHIGHASNTGKGYFTVIITSDEFNGQNTLKRHRMVYEALGKLMEDEIHALSIKAKASNE